MQEVEMFSHIKMCPRGSMGMMVTRLPVLARVFCLSCGSPGLPADSRIEPAVWHPNGLFSHSFIKYAVCDPR